MPVAFASKARTATHRKSFVNVAGAGRDRARGVIVWIDVTAVTDTPSVVFKIQARNPAAGGFTDILESAAIVGTGTTVLRVHPDLTASANLIAKDVLPEEWEILATHADADSITYSTGYQYLG